MKFYKNDMSNPGVSSKRLVEAKADALVKAGTSYYVALPMEYELYEVRTVSARADTKQGVTVSLYADEAYKEEIYRSLEQPVIEDIVNVPARDASGNRLLYVGIRNGADQDANVVLKIKATNL